MPKGIRNHPKPLPPLSELRKWLCYDPETGILIWVGSSRKGWNGKVAGSLANSGRLEVGLPVGRFLCHRIAWVFIHGDQEDPFFEPDHIDRDATNNRANNLRAATRTQQGYNRTPTPAKSSGLRGACFDDAHKTKKWRAQIQINGKYTYLGRFFTPEEAHNCYMEMAKKIHGEFFVP